MVIRRRIIRGERNDLLVFIVGRVQVSLTRVRRGFASINIRVNAS